MGFWTVEMIEPLLDLAALIATLFESEVHYFHEDWFCWNPFEIRPPTELRWWPVCDCECLMTGVVRFSYPGAVLTETTSSNWSAPHNLADRFSRVKPSFRVSTVRSPRPSPWVFPLHLWVSDFSRVRAALDQSDSTCSRLTAMSTLVSCFLGSTL